VSSFLTGFLAGAPTAAAATLCIGWLVNRNSKQQEGSADLTDEDRAAIADDFVVHTKAVTQQVSTYADLLADGDVLLRERLRQFEKGGC